MSRRHENKRSARWALDMRRYFVAEAGYHFRFSYELPLAGDAWYRNYCAKRGIKTRKVSVPRSLRKQLGRWVGA